MRAALMQQWLHDFIINPVQDWWPGFLSWLTGSLIACTWTMLTELRSCVWTKDVIGFKSRPLLDDGRSGVSTIPLLYNINPRED